MNGLAPRPNNSRGSDPGSTTIREKLAKRETLRGFLYANLIRKGLLYFASIRTFADGVDMKNFVRLWSVGLASFLVRFSFSCRANGGPG